jgi:uncharacterized protein (DUF2147 family)
METTVMRILSRSIVLAALLGATSAFAQSAATPVGLWRSFINGENGAPRSLVRVTESNGAYSGRIEKLIDPDYVKTCQSCKGDLADKPVEGLLFMTGFRKDGDKYVDGKLTDPEHCWVFSATLVPAADNKTMIVRGFLGISLLGKSQTFERVE